MARPQSAQSSSRSGLSPRTLVRARAQFAQSSLARAQSARAGSLPAPARPLSAPNARQNSVPPNAPEQYSEAAQLHLGSLQPEGHSAANRVQFAGEGLQAEPQAVAAQIPVSASAARPQSAPRPWHRELPRSGSVPARPLPGQAPEMPLSGFQNHAIPDGRDEGIAPDHDMPSEVPAESSFQRAGFSAPGLQSQTIKGITRPQSAPGFGQRNNSAQRALPPRPQSAATLTKQDRNTDGYIKHIVRVAGTVIRASHLPGTKILSKRSPRCVVQGIKGNSSIVDFFESQVGESSNPKWNAEWSYNREILAQNASEEFVGVKFMVYDGNEFLGGLDVDISDLGPLNVSREEELNGYPQVQIRGVKSKKGHFFFSLRVERKLLPPWGPPQKVLMKSMTSFTRVLTIQGLVVRARHLNNAMGRRSQPMCFVRCCMASGAILDMFNTKCSTSVVDPSWHEHFEHHFEDTLDQPVMLMFDIFAATGSKLPKDVLAAGNHLGSAFMPVALLSEGLPSETEGGRRKLPLLGAYHLFENRLGRDGSRQDPSAMAQKKDKKGSNVLSHVSLGTKKGSSYISVEFFAERANTSMPYAPLLEDPLVIEKEDLVDDPDEELQYAFAMWGAKVFRVSAAPRFVAMCGRVGSVMNLAGSFGTRGGLYVVVEAQTNSGWLFMHRTRCKKNAGIVDWNEQFFFHVPCDPDNPYQPLDVSMVRFNLQDSAETQGEDVLVGSCDVDVSYSKNTDWVNEHKPLLGVQSRHKAVEGLRRYPTLSLELRVERRLFRAPGVLTADAELLKVPRHGESRSMHHSQISQGAYRPYRDQSQTEIYEPLGFDAARRVMTRMDADTLGTPTKDTSSWLEQRKTASWALSESPSPSAVINEQSVDKLVADGSGILAGGDVRTRAEVSEKKFREMRKELLEPLGEPSSFDYMNCSPSKIPSKIRAASLPFIALDRLATNFGEHYERLNRISADPFDECIQPPKLLSDAQCDLAQEFRKKPPLEHYTCHSPQKPSLASPPRETVI